jgi:EAL domain-containing protein (putative c-di-GMP-specific phosphodiesterase class I)
MFERKPRRTWTEGSLSAAVPGVRGLRPEEVGVVFQPIVEVATGALFAHEALVRCKRPEYAAPPVLFEHAVKEDACGGLGRLVRDAAFAACGNVPLFVNLHPDELSARWLVRTDDPICFHREPVYLEVTESAAFTHFDLCMSVLKELCARTGARLVIDDFGAGYSNLERLVELEPSVVKLDLALIRGVDSNKRKQAVVRHVANLCTELGALVVAEGIETLDELLCVRDIGVGYVQGYFIARPGAPPPDHAWPFPIRPIEGRDSASRTRVAAAVSGAMRASADPRVDPPSVRPRPRFSNIPGARKSKIPGPR